MTRRGAHGFAATELVLGVVLILVPTVLLIGSLPSWLDRRVAAETAARDAARLAARAWPAPAGAGVAAVVSRVAADHRLPRGTLQASVTPPPLRGGHIVVRVVARMPGIRVPALGRVGAWRWTALASFRVDDYAGR